MHMFYHLGKDCSIYRFKCKYPNCDVEHYRKDQMENHHSKQHGKIDPTLMEDRTAELFNSCQVNCTSYRNSLLICQLLGRLSFHLFYDVYWKFSLARRRIIFIFCFIFIH
uniref:C2H2-type domain-containing protein n=1 Tax=Parascaris equorum TaxID=6256 RepID=A0A914S5Y5_PAREQ